MKTYIGIPDGTGGSVTVVETEDVVGQPELRRYPLKHHVRHSPTGFAWGYGGSGPAELARCLLIDHFDDRALCPSCTGTGMDTTDPEDATRCFYCGGDGIRLPVAYQDFKAQVIASFGQTDPWQLTSEKVDEWVCAWAIRHPEAIGR